MVLLLHSLGTPALECGKTHGTYLLMEKKMIRYHLCLLTKILYYATKICFLKVEL